MPAYPGMDPPPGYRAETQSNRGLLWGGAMTAGIGYATALGYGLSRNFEGGLGALAVPVVGPWLALGKRNFGCDEIRTIDDLDAAQSCRDDTYAEAKTFAVLGTVGLLQAVGGTLFVVGLFDRRDTWVREDLGSSSFVLDGVALPGGGLARIQGRF